MRSRQLLPELGDPELVKLSQLAQLSQADVLLLLRPGTYVAQPSKKRGTSLDAHDLGELGTTEELVSMLWEKVSSLAAQWQMAPRGPGAYVVEIHYLLVHLTKARRAEKARGWLAAGFDERVGPQLTLELADPGPDPELQLLRAEQSKQVQDAIDSVRAENPQHGTLLDIALAGGKNPALTLGLTVKRYQNQRRAALKGLLRRWRSAYAEGSDWDPNLAA